MCRCDKCRADVWAYSLNHLQPHYVVTDVGEAFVRTDAMSTQFQANILTAIMNGIAIVKKNPRHDNT